MKLSMEKINAIHDLCPGAAFSISGDDLSTLVWMDDLPRPTDEEILAHIEVMKDRKEAEAYKIIRKNNYPDIGDQLDMLYHDIKSGNLESGNWITSIDVVKNKYPKT